MKLNKPLLAKRRFARSEIDANIRSRCSRFIVGDREYFTCRIVFTWHAFVLGNRGLLVNTGIEAPMLSLLQRELMSLDRNKVPA